MRIAFLLGLALIPLLTWTTSQAERHTYGRLQRRAKAGRVRLDAKGSERSDRAARPGFGSAISVHGHRKEGLVQVEQTAPAKPLSEHTGLMMQDEGTPTARATRVLRVPSSAGSPNLLASFAGKNRVLVITAPHDSDGYYRMMMSLLKPDVYCELAERHVHQIVMFHQEGEMGGKVRRISTEGKVLEEPLDTALIPRLMSFLKLEKGKECD